MEGGIQPTQKVEQVISKPMSDELGKLFSEPSYVVDMIEHYLKCHKYTKDGWVVIKEPLIKFNEQSGENEVVKELNSETGKQEAIFKPIKPLINDLGWKQTAAMLWHYVNPITITSQLDKDLIISMTLEFARSYAHLLRHNFRDWEVEIKNIRQLLIQLTAITFMVLSKAEKTSSGAGMFLNEISKTFSSTFAQVPTQAKKLLGLV